MCHHHWSGATARTIVFSRLYPKTVNLFIDVLKDTLTLCTDAEPSHVGDKEKKGL